MFSLTIGRIHWKIHESSNPLENHILMPHSLFNEVPEDKLKHIIDAQQLHTAYRAAFQEAKRYQGRLNWESANGTEYLVSTRYDYGYASGKASDPEAITPKKSSAFTRNDQRRVASCSRPLPRNSRNRSRSIVRCAWAMCRPGHQGVGPDRKRRAGQENHDHRHECDVRLRLRGQCHVCRLHHGDARSRPALGQQVKAANREPGPKGLARRHSAWRPILHENRGQAIHASEQRGLPGRLDQARRRLPTLGARPDLGQRGGLLGGEGAQHGLASPLPDSSRS